MTCSTLNKKKHSCSIFTVFVRGYMSTATLISFLKNKLKISFFFFGGASEP